MSTTHRECSDQNSSGVKLHFNHKVTFQGFAFGWRNYSKVLENFMLRWKIRGSHPGSKVPWSHGQTFSMCPCAEQRDHSAHRGGGGGWFYKKCLMICRSCSLCTLEPRPAVRQPFAFTKQRIITES